MTARHPAGNPRGGGAGRAAQAAVSPQAGAAEAAPPPERLAYSVDEAALLTGLSRDLLYDEMRRGNLHYRKVGRRRLITRQHLEQFLDISGELRILVTRRHPRLRNGGVRREAVRRLAEAGDALPVYRLIWMGLRYAN
jgi:excisionase family DNA binding protein